MDIVELPRIGGKRTIVHAENGKYYYVSTVLSFDHGWETMVFPYDNDNQRVSDWGDLYCMHYGSEDEAISMHRYITHHIGIFVDLWGEKE